MIVHANIYNPTKSIYRSGANEKAECQIIECSMHQNCGLYKRGECACRHTTGHLCPYGKWRIETGYTRRARRFGEWIRERETKYDSVGYLDIPTCKLADVGDYVYLPYSHIDLSDPDLFSGRFVHRDDFSITNIQKMVENRPMALFGGEIKSYQKDVVPVFVLHLSECMPDIFVELCKACPRVSDIVKSHSNVGRKAILSTIRPNVGVFVGIHGDEWVWDGEYLTMTNKTASFMPVKHSEVRIKPVDGESMKISSESQVDENTVFLD